MEAQRTQNRTKVGRCGLEGLLEAAGRDGKLMFVSLLCHADVGGEVFSDL